MMICLSLATLQTKSHSLIVKTNYSPLTTNQKTTIETPPTRPQPSPDPSPDPNPQPVPTPEPQPVPEPK